ncbi:hypothetical protein SIM91_43680 [Rhodococcus opacus]|uniref:hypothetical protein n=1 Tax=Rhodococcus opacus TaxID=37919 RepID=UPI0002A3862E|nr:hypothetical protein [Rhodococcus opacus]ELB88603.1 hypothetical protein Rwratislav_33707 [Rhodococcus wratislaviensis IFP 2016]MDX5970061.1 hypothetical protein [Rhodococcus opacus]CAG7634279.1 hypothetical protein E143388_07587 [Rhodococcus opacus]
MGESAVPPSAIVDAAELLTQKADVLLERLADRVMACPPAGSPAWYAQRTTSTVSPAETFKARLLVRIAIAHHAHFDLVEDIDRAHAAGAQWSEIGDATGLSATAARRRWEPAPVKARQRETGQLAIW